MLVLLYSLCSFGHVDKEVHNNEAIVATEYLLKTNIPQFATWLETNYKNVHDLRAKLTELIHREGINCRYLGNVMSYCKKKKLRSILLVEVK